VYLLSTTINKSGYQFLPSNKASVFLDGNFVSNTTMNNVLPGSSFRVFLGVDSSISINYSTEELKKKKESSRSSISWLSSSDSKLKNKKQYSQKCIIKSSKPVPVIPTSNSSESSAESSRKERPAREMKSYIIVVDSLPASQDENITVSISEPSPSEIWNLPMDKKSNNNNRDLSGSPLYPLMQQASSSFSGSQDYELMILILMLLIQNSDIPESLIDIVVQNSMSNSMISLKPLTPGSTVEVCLRYEIAWPEESMIVVRED